MAVYVWVRDGVQLRGELNPQQVAELVAEGIVAVLVQRCLLWRDGEFSVQEVTADDLAALQADGWAADGLGDGEAVVDPILDPLESRGWREKTAGERTPLDSTDRAHARVLLHDADAVAAVQGVAAEIASIAALGVSIEELTFQGVEAALETALEKETNQGRINKLLRAGMKLQTRWNRVVFHAGSLRDAYRLWPELQAVLAEL